MPESNDPQAVELAAMPPEFIRMMVESGSIDKRLARIALQIKEAQAVRGASGPKGRHTGRTYVAASPLEHLASGINKYRAGKELKDLREQQTSEDTNQADAMEEFFRQYTAGQRGGVVQPEGAITFPMEQPEIISGAPEGVIPDMRPPPQPQQPPLGNPRPDIPPYQIQPEVGPDYTKTNVTVGGIPGYAPPPAAPNTLAQRINSELPPIGWNTMPEYQQKYAETLRKSQNTFGGRL